MTLDASAKFTMPPAASKLTPAMTYVKILLEQHVLGGMVGEQQVCSFLAPALEENVSGIISHT